MQIFYDVADVLTAEGVLEGRHDTAASFQNSRADLSVSGGRSAGEERTQKNPVEQGRLFRHHEFSSIVASAAVHLKHPLATRNFPSLFPAPKMRTAGQGDGNESREQAPPKG